MINILLLFVVIFSTDDIAAVDVTVQSMVLFTGPPGRLFWLSVKLCTDVTLEMLR